MPKALCVWYPKDTPNITATFKKRLGINEDTTVNISFTEYQFNNLHIKLELDGCIYMFTHKFSQLTTFDIAFVIADYYLQAKPEQRLNMVDDFKVSV